MGLNQIMVTVVITIYNPIWEKLKRTLNSILLQEDVSYDVIITDDGSEIDCFELLRRYFNSFQNISYRLVKNENNIGTVANIYNSLQYADGRYVFITSPGDVLFDSTVLKDFVSFAEDTKSSLLFGNAINYSQTGDVFSFSTNRRPPKPIAFDGTHSLIYEKTAFFFGNSVLGAAYFRKRETAIKYFNEILGYSRYVEDTTSTACALLNGERLRYYDRNMVWYECNTGISGARNPEWKHRLLCDFSSVYNYLKQTYGNDTVFCQFYAENVDKKRLNPIKVIFKHPLLMLFRIRIKMLPGVSIKYSENDVNWFYMLGNEVCRCK